eukprot:Opistho-2@90635
MSRMPVEKDAKHIRVFVNGDGNFAGRKMVLNDRIVRTFDAFLDQVTDTCRPAFGAVRNVYTPVGGTPVTNMDAFQNGKDYVVGGKERFRKIDYEQIHEPPKAGHNTEHKKTEAFEASFVKRRKTVVRSARAVKEAKLAGHPIIITVFRNGDTLFHGVKLILTKRNLADFDHVLTVITERIKLQSGFARRLYTVDGRQVHDPSDITNDGQYVACGFFDKFKRLPYSTGGVEGSPKGSPKSKQKKLLMIEYSPMKGQASDAGAESDSSPPRKPIKVKHTKKKTEEEDLSLGEPVIKKQARQAREEAAAVAAAEEGQRKRAALEAAEKKKKEEAEKRDREYEERERKIKEKKEKERKEKERAAELARQAAAKKKEKDDAERRRKAEEEEEEKLVAIVPDAPAVADEKGLSRRTEKPVDVVDAEEISDEEDIEELDDGGNEFNVPVSMDNDDGDLAFDSGDDGAVAAVVAKSKPVSPEASTSVRGKAPSEAAASVVKSRSSLAGSVRSIKSTKNSVHAAPAASSVRSSRASLKAAEHNEPAADASEDIADEGDGEEGGEEGGDEAAQPDPEEEEGDEGDEGDDEAYGDGLPDESS